jgi:hypothetical protein
MQPIQGSSQTDPKTAEEIARISAKLEGSVSWGFGILKWANRLLTIGALSVVAITLFLLYRPKPKPSWVGTVVAGSNVVGNFYSVEACKYALRKTGGDCSQPCTGKEKSPSDCGSVVHVEPSN